VYKQTFFETWLKSDAARGKAGRESFMISRSKFPHSKITFGSVPFRLKARTMTKKGLKNTGQVVGREIT